jgi:Ca2+/Na+ antiporter
MTLRIRHIIVGAWLFFWLFVVSWRVYWWLGLTFFALFLPLYWQTFVTIKEEVHELRERAGLSGEPAARQTADAQRDKSERA